jgi:hypothetical protein
MPLLLCCCLTLTSCLEQSHRLSNHSLNVEHEWISPDHSKVLIHYNFDTGALGYSRGFDALIPAAKINEDLSRYLLPEKYNPLQWEKDGSLTVQIDCVRWLRFGQDFWSHKDKDFLYETPINVRIYDETEGVERKIEADIPSPNRKLRLVAYRYPSNFNYRIHVSIIRSDEPIPRHGNFYIGFNGHDGLLKGEWINDQQIIFYTASDPGQTVSGIEGSEGFIKNTLGIKYQIVIDDRLRSSLWVKDNK